MMYQNRSTKCTKIWQESVNEVTLSDLFYYNRTLVLRALSKVAELVLFYLKIKSFPQQGSFNRKDVTTRNGLRSLQSSRLRRQGQHHTTQEMLNTLNIQTHI